MSAYLAMVPGGITVLGLAAISPLGIAGSVLSLFTGGLAAALIAGVCATLAERAQSRSLAGLSGPAPRLPHVAWVLVIPAPSLLGVSIPSFLSPPGMTVFRALQNPPLRA